MATAPLPGPAIEKLDANARDYYGLCATCGVDLLISIDPLTFRNSDVCWITVAARARISDRSNGGAGVLTLICPYMDLRRLVVQTCCHNFHCLF